jgi:hypothetical protein
VAGVPFKPSLGLSGDVRKDEKSGIMSGDGFQPSRKSGRSVIAALKRCATQKHFSPSKLFAGKGARATRATFCGQALVESHPFAKCAKDGAPLVPLIPTWCPRFAPYFGPNPSASSGRLWAEEHSCGSAGSDSSAIMSCPSNSISTVPTWRKGEWEGNSRSLHSADHRAFAIICSGRDDKVFFRGRARLSVVP